MKQIDNRLIQEEINEYYYETKVRPKEEQKALEKGLEEMYMIQAEEKNKTINEFFEKNPQETCKKCVRTKNNCLLYVNLDCGYIGKRVSQNFENGREYNIIESSKGVWDEVFYPLSDEQIEQLEVIF